MENKKKAETQEGIAKLTEALNKVAFGGLELGFEIGRLKDRYCFNDIVEFLKGNRADCYHYDLLKDFYDRYGYENVNRSILHIVEHYGIDTTPKGGEN